MSTVIKKTVKPLIPKALIEKGYINPGVSINIYAYEDQHKQEMRL